MMVAVELFNHKFSIDCVKQLHSECSIVFKDMQSFHICYESAKADVTHLDLMLPEASEVPQGVDVEVQLAQKSVGSANNGLMSFMLDPPDVTGKKLFLHMIKFRELHKEESVVSKHLNVEVTLDNLEVLKTAKKLLVGDTADIKR
eukprot:9321615-Ditylum_brightwellii.AAC.1